MTSFVSRRWVLRLALFLIIVGIGLVRTQLGGNRTVSPSDSVESAWRDHASGIMVEAAGSVQRLLADDNEGSRHQRFLLVMPSGQTLLVAHNIDVAPRIPLEVGDQVKLRGQYEWNEKGGVVHWTHHDPQGRHEGGWVEHGDRRYQ